MNLTDPLSLFSGITLGIIGTGMLIYGKKQQRFGPAIVGLALCALPYLVASVVLDWLLAAACCAGLYYASREN